jgi:hypothetical protein
MLALALRVMAPHQLDVVVYGDFRRRWLPPRSRIGGKAARCNSDISILGSIRIYVARHGLAPDASGPDLVPWPCLPPSNSLEGSVNGLRVRDEQAARFRQRRPPPRSRGLTT